MRTKPLKRVRKTSRQYNLFFIRPKVRTNAHLQAVRLAMLNNVSEVMVTEGECGFIVKTTDGLNSGSNRNAALSKSSYKKIRTYYQYRK